MNDSITKIPLHSQGISQLFFLQNFHLSVCYFELLCTYILTYYTHVRYFTISAIMSRKVTWLYTYWARPGHSTMAISYTMRRPLFIVQRFHWLHLRQESAYEQIVSCKTSPIRYLYYIMSTDFIKFYQMYVNYLFSIFACQIRFLHRGLSASLSDHPMGGCDIHNNSLYHSNRFYPTENTPSYKMNWITPFSKTVPLSVMSYKMVLLLLVSGTTLYGRVPSPIYLHNDMEKTV